MKKSKKKVDVSTLNGLSIYHKTKRTVYSPFFTKKAYIITENNARQYISYIQGYLVAVVVFLLSYMIYKNVWVSVSLALIFLITTFVTFYLNFLRKANVIDNYKKPARDNFVLRQAKNLENKNIWTIIICTPLLALSIMLNSYFNKYEGFMYYFMVVMAVLSLLYGLFHIYILIYKKNNQL